MYGCKQQKYVFAHDSAVGARLCFPHPQQEGLRRAGERGSPELLCPPNPTASRAVLNMASLRTRSVRPL